MEEPQKAKVEAQKTAIETAKEWGGKLSPIHQSSGREAGDETAADIVYRKSFTIIHPRDSSVRPACSTIPNHAHDLSTLASILDISQSTGLQG